jgi:phosphatidylinositol alpha-1,6-mannosyltransferase
MMKKILIITNDFYPSRGGIQECIMGLANSFGRNGTVIAPNYPGYNTRNDNLFRFTTLRTNGLRQDRLLDKILFLFIRRPFVFLVRTAGLLYSFSKCNSFDFILCGHITNVFVGIFLKKVRKVQLGTIIHGRELFLHGVLKPFKVMFAKFLLNRSDILFMSNSFMVDRLIHMGIPEKKIIKIPFGVNIRKKVGKVEYKKKNAHKVILTIGRLVERKGHEYVLNALPLILETHPQTKYCIVGKGPMEKRLRTIVAKNNLSHIVEFHGEVENIADFYSQCDVFVMPSRFIEKKGDVEGFGLVYLEANFFGKPVIAGNSGGISDAVIDGVTGFLVDPEDPKDIAEKIITIFKDKTLAKKLGEQGRKRILREFTWDKAAEIIEQKMTEIKRDKAK